MEKKKIEIVWSKRAEKSLTKIYDYYFSLSENSAENILNKILATVSSLYYFSQYQVDETNPSYRRMICKHYKIVYSVKENQIRILNIFDSRQNPAKGKLK